MTSPPPGVAVALALATDGETEGVGEFVGVADGDREPLGVIEGVLELERGGAGQRAGELSCAKSHPPGAHRVPATGPAMTPAKQPCSPLACVHQPQGSMPLRMSDFALTHVAQSEIVVQGSPALPGQYSCYQAHVSQSLEVDGPVFEPGRQPSGE
jgi:hypothetical protein